MNTALAPPRPPNHKVKEQIKPLRGKRIGLVLAGGGAKGAYQAGCLDYLQRCGIDNFEMVVGASAGSLNAAAAGSGKIGDIVRTWQNISMWKVIAISPGLPWIMLGVPFAFPERQSRWLIPVTAILINTILTILLFFVGLGLLAILYNGILALAWVSPSPVNRLPFVPGQLFIGLIRGSLYGAASAMRFRPVRRLIEDAFFYDGAEQLKMHCPVFVTLCGRRLWFDPDRPEFAPDFDGDVNLRRPHARGGWIPEYVDVNRFSREKLITHLRASAALPLAFRQVRIGPDRYTDGGVVDNVPINKALEFDCDILIVIYLQQLSSPNFYLEKVRWLRRAIKLSRMSVEKASTLYHDWRADIWRSSSTDDDERSSSTEDDDWDDWDYSEEEQKWTGWLIHGRPPQPYGFEIVPHEQLGDLPEFINVIPSRSVGGLLSGTLNFTRRKANRLIDLGRSDMEIALLHYLKQHGSTQEPTATS